MQIIAGSADFSIEKYMDIIDHGESVLKNWFKLKGWRWKGYKEVCEPFRPYYEVYRDLPPFSDKIQWVKGVGEPEWNDYHLIVDGKRYEAKHKSYEDWLRFYQNS